MGVTLGALLPLCSALPRLAPGIGATRHTTTDALRKQGHGGTYACGEARRISAAPSTCRCYATAHSAARSSRRLPPLCCRARVCCCCRLDSADDGTAWQGRNRELGAPQCNLDRLLHSGVHRHLVSCLLASFPPSLCVLPAELVSFAREPPRASSPLCRAPPLYPLSLGPNVFSPVRTLGRRAGGAHRTWHLPCLLPCLLPCRM